MTCSVPWCDGVARPNEEKCDWHLLLELEEKFRPVIADLIAAGLKAQGVLPLGA